MKIHILGICGTFMGGLAVLAKRLGHEVSGSDQGIYPPMSEQLVAHGITLHEGYDAGFLDDSIDCVVVGNALSRGNEAVEALLNDGRAYVSGPQWLAENVLQGRWVLAVSGTHGKTTTSSMLAWILEYAGMSPGFLIGGVPQDFAVSARLGETPFFVIEADEYDSAFFDKRSKFVHYHPRTLVLNNLEYDHADIFPDLPSIQRQFHHLLRTVPGAGLIVNNAGSQALNEVIEMGCWTPVESVDVTAGADWGIHKLDAQGSHFEVMHKGTVQGVVTWAHTGEHNLHNALSAIVAARHVGVAVEHALAALCEFKGVKRRMELLAEPRGIKVYDDFAHHPTAIALTLQGARASLKQGRLFVILDLRSNTMRMGIHKHVIELALEAADRAWVYHDDSLSWNPSEVFSDDIVVLNSTQQIIDEIVPQLLPDDHVLIMSNGGFQGIHGRLIETLELASRQV
ncbi:MAG: UDP-N-acetylmuramate:L-alanyl-gamma-D-glutamyl-meso-diaminopimelate ligase [Gammaproteobacteria bacterium]|nr:UDP-N-acetylmuramate:L-alanyl-gamma-D-glutamyl-meso-diaminopimelate ligase [Gammaproteobacteria bacterium]